MKTLRWILFFPAFIVCVLIMQYYYEPKTEKMINGFNSVSGIYGILALIFGLSMIIGFAISLNLVLLVSPNVKLGNRILLGYFAVAFSIGYAFNPNPMNKLHVVFILIIFVSLVLGAINKNPVMLYFRYKERKV